MSLVILDIGAGTKKFAQLFRKFNSSLRATYICGDPNWKRSWNGEICPNKILMVQATYSNFGVQTSSVDMVTLNAPDITKTDSVIEREAARALKQDVGILISANPIGVHPEISDKYFNSVSFTKESDDSRSESDFASFDGTYGTFLRKAVCGMLLEGDRTLMYPASPMIQSRLAELELPEELRVRNAQYCSDSSAAPSVKVWIRNKETVW